MEQGAQPVEPGAWSTRGRPTTAAPFLHGARAAVARAAVALAAVALPGAGCGQGGIISGHGSVDAPRVPDAPPAADDGAPGADAPLAAADGAPAALDAPGEPDAPVPWPCAEVAHIGDSLTAYTVGPLTAAYLAVGATAEIDAYGGRAIKQKLPDDPRTGLEAAAAFRAAGFSGCWVIALGTNDTANVAAGAWYTRAEAIDEMMTAIDPGAAAPVMWVNTYTTRTSGYWSNANMILWNEALVAAQARWANLAIFDWAATAATGVAPYSDGIHHTSAGYDVRNAAIAEALVAQFPR